jgi:DNA uptake protein ComE-like DNA-binding protein
MELRSAAGITAACAALTVCVGVALHTMPSQGPSAAEQRPWGTLSKAPFAPSGAPTQLPRRLNVAMRQPAATPEASSPSPATSDSAGVSADPPAIRPTLVEVASISPTQATSEPEPEATPANQIVVATPPADMKAMAEPVAAEPADDARIDINKASVETLNHLPGRSRLGRAIVSHRPYHAVADLLAKRVLRDSDFHRVQMKIKVD